MRFFSTVFQIGSKFFPAIFQLFRGYSTVIPGGRERGNVLHGRRTMAILRMACRVLGCKRQRSGLGWLGLGAVMVGLTFAAPAANALEVSVNSVTRVLDAGVASFWRDASVWRFIVNGGGELIVQGGAVITATNPPSENLAATNNIGHDTNGTMRIIGPGTSVTADNYFFIGRGGTGHMELLDGASLTSAQMRIGQNGTAADPGTGTFIASGAGTRWITTGDGANSYVVVGANNNTDGTLTVTDGAVAEVESFFTVAGGGVGQATISNNAMLTTHNELRVGQGGTGNGTLDIESGGRLNSAKAYIGNGGTGTVTVDGAASTLSVVNELFLGGGTIAAGARNGALNVTNGGLATADIAHIGYTGTGHLGVSGASSRFSVADTVYIANQAASKGTMEVSAGGQASANSLHVGYQGDGQLTVDGAGSELYVTDTLHIGSAAGATGNAGISDGGRVVAGTVTFGSGAGSGGGTLAIDNAILATGQVRSDGANAAQLDLDGGTLRLIGHQAALFEGMTPGDITFGAGGATFDTQGFAVQTATELNGVGGLTKRGSGTLTLGEQASYDGGTVVAQGTLAAGGVNVFATNGLHDVGTSGNLLLNGFDQRFESLRNAGAVTFGGAAPGTTLTLSDDYTGVGGVIAFNTTLGDDNSISDLLVVEGDTHGSSLVRVTNVGGSGAETSADGIRLIQVDGVSDAGAFALSGPAIGGAYRYDLFHNGISKPADGHWYLRSAGLAPTVPVYENYPQVLLGLISLPTLQQRVGERHRTADEADQTAVWTRIEAAHNHARARASIAHAKYDADTTLVQIGVDGQLSTSAAGMLIGGITAQFSRALADIFSSLGNGSNTTDSYGIGAALTWYGENGFYVDGQAQIATLRSDMAADSIGIIGDGIHGSGYALSLEAGHRIALNDQWSLTPQAQLAYASVDFDAFTDRFGAEVSLRKGDSLKGRIGIAASYDSGNDGSNVYGIANLTHEFLEGTSVAVSGIDASFSPQRFGGELGFGGTYKWDDKYRIHGEVLATTSFEGGYGIKGTAGLTAAF